MSQAVENARVLLNSSIAIGYALTNGASSFRLIAGEFLHCQHGLLPFQQFLLLYGLSVCVHVLKITSLSQYSS
jgi:hypothetical protein